MKKHKITSLLKGCTTFVFSFQTLRASVCVIVQDTHMICLTDFVTGVILGDI